MFTFLSVTPGPGRRILERDVIGLLDWCGGGERILVLLGDLLIFAIVASSCRLLAIALFILYFSWTFSHGSVSNALPSAWVLSSVSNALPSALVLSSVEAEVVWCFNGSFCVEVDSDATVWVISFILSLTVKVGGR
jgi:hypothetical protein